MGVARLASAVVAAVVAAAAVSPAPAAQIVWSDGVVTARGRGIPNELTRNQDAARTAAERGACEDAIRSALAVVEATPFGGAATVGEALSEPGRRERLLAAWRKTAPLDRSYFSNDAVVARYRFDLAAVVRALGPPESAAPPAAPPPVTPVTIDARRLDPAPERALAPRILDLEGHEIYGPAQVRNGTALLVRYLEKGPADHAPGDAIVVDRPGPERSTLVVRPAGVEGLRRAVSVAIWVRPR